MFQPTVNIDEFITLSNAGVKIATFVQIRDALVKRYREIYGSDIDLSTGSADGVFVNDLALIINNILQSVNTMYANLDVETASGVYLDILCALSNITRKQATKSFAYLNITNTGSLFDITQQDPVFIDKSGVQWFADTTYTIAQNETKSVKVVCEKSGAIQAPAGWISQTIEALGNIEIVQPEDAVVGLNVESDAELRFRRAQSTGATGTTVIDSLVGALLEVSGIRDVKIINNNGAESSATDGSTLAAHSIYVVIRLNDGVTIDDSVIGKIIYEKLTPGIQTSMCSVDDEDKEYKYIAEINNIHAIASNQMVYWRQAKPINPQITLTITPLTYFSVDSLETIANVVMGYLNSLLIDTQVTTNDLLIQTVYADPTFKGKSTYTVVGTEIDDQPNHLTYYDYKNAFVAWSGEITDGTNEEIITDGTFTKLHTSYYICLNTVINEDGAFVSNIVNNQFTLGDTTYTIVSRTFNKTDTTNYEIILQPGNVTEA